MKSFKRAVLYFCLLTSFLGANSTAFAKLPVIVNGKVLPSLADMLERVTPAVVDISTKGQAKTTNINDPVYRHFFGNSLPEKRKRIIGTGSGIIVDAQLGYIVTNAHVINGADKIIVTLTDRRQFYAAFVGQDLKADVAVLRIQPDNLKAISIADSKKVRVGDFVVAIGNPYGIGQSVSSGIVSGLGRSGLGIDDYENFIQTDATINPGNSGGALVNLRGKLIGINTAILGGKGGSNVGIAFAIPSAMIVNIADQIIENGFVNRGQLGIEVQDVRPTFVKAFKLLNGQGAIISSVVPHSPADIAGIKAGDVVIKVDDIDVKSSAHLKSLVGNLRIGSRVNLKFMRDGAIKELSALVGQVRTERYGVNSHLAKYKKQRSK